MYVRRKKYITERIEKTGEYARCTGSLARSTPDGCLKGFIIVVVIVVAPDAAAGAPRHARVLVVAAQRRVRSRGCRSLVPIVGNGIEVVVVLREAEA